MINAVSYLYEFGPFRLDPTERLLLRAGQPIPITPKAFDLLMVLVQRSGHLIEKRELLEAVWPASFVEEGNLSVMVHALRKAFGSDHRDYTYIETVAKRGYRFVAEVKLIEYAPAALVAPASRLSLELAGPQLPLIAPATISPSADTWDRPVPLPSKPKRRLPRNNRLLLLLALIPIVATGSFLWRKISTANQPSAAIPQNALAHSLAILPFATIGGKSDDIYLGIGISDAITTKLGSTRKIVVRPTSAMLRYVGAARDPEAAGREQKVDAVLDGRIQREGDRLRLTLQLVRVSDGVQMWGGTFDEKYTNVFAVEDAVSEQVARSIRLELTGAEQNRLAQRPTENSDAYQAYVKGRYFWNKRTVEGLRKGLEYFQAAVALDNTYTQAYVGIADSYALLGLMNAMSPKEAFPKAKEAASKALEMDPELADAHATLGFVNFYFDWDGLAAESEFQHALRSNPNYAMAHAWYAEDLAAMGRFAEAFAETKRAQESDPVSLTVGAVYGNVAYLAGQNDEAVDELKKAIEIDPAYPRLHFRLGNAYLRRGMYEQALPEFLKAVQLTGGGDQYGDQYYESAVGYTYAILGKTADARKVLDTLVRRSETRYVPAYAIALIYTGLGDKEHVFEWLEKSYQDRSTSMAYLKVDPILKDYRSDPRFIALANRIRF